MDKRDEDASEAFAWADRSIEYRFGGYAFTPAFSPNAEHIATLARLASLAAPAAPGREGIARIVGEANAVAPWWWEAPFDDGSDETAEHLRSQDFAVADRIIALKPGSQS